MAEIANREKFSAILVKTVSVSFMENAVGWHGKATKPAECEQALAELETARKKILEA